MKEVVTKTEPEVHPQENDPEVLVEPDPEADPEADHEVRLDGDPELRRDTMCLYPNIHCNCQRVMWQISGSATIACKSDAKGFIEVQS